MAKLGGEVDPAANRDQPLGLAPVGPEEPGRHRPLQRPGEEGSQDGQQVRVGGIGVGLRSPGIIGQSDVEQHEEILDRDLGPDQQLELREHDGAHMLRGGEAPHPGIGRRGEHHAATGQADQVSCSRGRQRHCLGLVFA